LYRWRYFCFSCHVRRSSSLRNWRNDCCTPEDCRPSVSAVHPVYGGEDLGLKVPTSGNIFGVGLIIAMAWSLWPWVCWFCIMLYRSMLCGQIKCLWGTSGFSRHYRWGGVFWHVVLGPVPFRFSVADKRMFCTGLRGKIRSLMFDYKLNSHNFHFNPPPSLKTKLWRMLKLVDLQV
jgi:hypothetical protein